MSEVNLDIDERGVPALFLARAPGQVAEQTPSGVSLRRGARSGNPNFDPASGRFAKGGGGKDPQQSIPTGVDPEAWQRRLDYVRDVARTLPDLSVTHVQSYLEGRVADISQVDIDAFIRDVRIQRMTDVADMLHAQLQGSVGKKGVRVVAPKSFQKRLMANMDDTEVVQVARLLEGRGWDAEDIKKQIVSKVTDDERKERLEQQFGDTGRRRK